MFIQRVHVFVHTWTEADGVSQPDMLVRIYERESR